MTEEKNPLIEPENYYEGYNASMQKFSDSQPKHIAFDELCFNLFGLSDDGKKFLEILKERFIFPSVPCKLAGGDFPSAAIYYEGYREAFRQLIGQVEGYKQRIAVEAQKGVLDESKK